MVTRASKALWTEVNPEYQVDPRDFTDADIAAGKLREADDADTAQNRAIVRRVLEAAFPALTPGTPAAPGGRKSGQAPAWPQTQRAARPATGPTTPPMTPPY